MPTKGIYVDDAMDAKIKEWVAKTGAPSESDFLKKIVDRELSRLETGSVEEEGETTTPRGRRQTVTREYTKDPLDRIAEKMEKILGVKLMNSLIRDLELSSDLKSYLGNRNPNFPASSQSTTPEQPLKRDTLEVVREIKALEILGTTTTDPETKALLKTLTDAQIEALKKPERSTTSYDDDRRKKLDDLKEYALTAKMFGGADERAEADKLMREELSKMREELHQSQLDLRDRELEWREKDLQHQIDEIRNAPTELDQITRLSDLSKKDDAIRAYMNAKLGVKTEAAMTPQKLKEYIESVQVPVGDILKGLRDYFAPKERVIPPPVEAPAPPLPTPALEQATLAPVEVSFEPTKSVSFGPPPKQVEAPTPTEEAPAPPTEETHVEESKPVESSSTVAEAPRPRRSAKKA